MWAFLNCIGVLIFYYIFHFLISGLQTSQDARFYATSARFDPFSNEGKPLVIQFTVKHEQKIDCGGGYVKVFPSDLDQTDMHGDSQYYIMFGNWSYLLLVNYYSNKIWKTPLMWSSTRSGYLWLQHQESPRDLQLQRQESSHQERN